MNQSTPTPIMDTDINEATEPGAELDPEYLEAQCVAIDAANEEIARAQHEQATAGKELAELPEGAAIRRDAARQRLDEHVRSTREDMVELLRERADSRAEMLRKMLGVLFREPAERDAAFLIHDVEALIERCDGVGECRELAGRIERCRVDGTPGLNELSRLFTEGLALLKSGAVAEVKSLAEAAA